MFIRGFGRSNCILFVVYLILFSLLIFNLLFFPLEAENGGGVCVRIRGKNGLSGVFDV